MAAEKIFENKIKKFIKENNGWYVKYWAGASYTKSGIPDILACMYGKFFGIEVKGPNGKASELQKYNIKKINESGGIGLILYPKDFDEFKKIVEKVKNGNI